MREGDARKAGRSEVMAEGVALEAVGKGSSCGKFQGRLEDVEGQGSLDECLVDNSGPQSVETEHCSNLERKDDTNLDSKQDFKTRERRDSTGSEASGMEYFVADSPSSSSDH